MKYSNIILQHTKRCLPLGLALLMPVAVFAQDTQAATAAATDLYSKEVFYLLLAAIGALILVLAVLLAAVYGMLNYYFKSQYNFTMGDVLKAPAMFNSITFNMLKTNAATQGETIDTPLDHNYDGIIELDNAPPPLFNFILYTTVIFAVIYIGYYHFGSGPDQTTEYNNEITEAEALRTKMAGATTGPKIDENNVTQLTDDAGIAKGKEIFTANCGSCHGAAGEGGVGPNMTDDNWIHGCDIKSIFVTIRDGVPDKGMIPWKASLPPDKIQQVASYLMTLRGTKPANPKAPQGEVCQPAPAAPAPADATTKSDSTASDNKEKTKAS